MKKIALLFLILLLNQNFGFAQTKSEIDTLLNKIAKTENSKEIIKTVHAWKILTYGEQSLLVLASFFTDSTLTKVKSECQERNLTKGEIAIIMADQVKRMPYAQLTGVQNCLATFCENNTNFIEYYLWAIKNNGVEKFQEKYRDWIAWTKLSDKEKRKIERINTRKFKKEQRKLRKRLRQAALQNQ